VRRFLTEQRRLIGALAVVLLLVGAAALVALAADLRSWERAVDGADTAYASGAVRSASWEADTVLGGGLSRALLALDDDLAYRSAVRRFWLSGPRQPIREFADVTRRTGAEREVALVGETETDPARRAQLAIFRGALLLEEARNSPAQREVFVRRSISEFRRAATVDPGNEEALYNLELALRLLRRGGSDSSSGQNSRSPLPAPGAGAATSGSGF
jgi:hypothetical protein